MSTPVIHLDIDKGDVDLALDPITSDLSIDIFHLSLSYQDGRSGCLH